MDPILIVVLVVAAVLVLFLVRALWKFRASVKMIPQIIRAYRAQRGAAGSAMSAGAGAGQAGGQAAGEIPEGMEGQIAAAAELAKNPAAMLVELDKARSAGAIDEETYQQARKQIMDQI